MIYRKRIYPLDARSALIAKRQFLDFYTFVMNIRDYDNITFPRHIPNNLFIQSLSAYIIETNNEKLCKETFGTIDYSALTKVRDEISAKAAGVIHEFGDDEIIYNVNNKLMAIFHEKELLEDAGLLNVIKNQSTKKKGRPKGDIKDCIMARHGDKIPDIIHKLEDALFPYKGKQAAFVIIAAIQLGYIRKPGFSEFDNKFPKKIMKKDYSRYITHIKNDEIKRTDVPTEIKDRLKI